MSATTSALLFMSHTSATTLLSMLALSASSKEQYYSTSHRISGLQAQCQGSADSTPTALLQQEHTPFGSSFGKS